MFFHHGKVGSLINFISCIWKYFLNFSIKRFIHQKSLLPVNSDNIAIFKSKISNWYFYFTLFRPFCLLQFYILIQQWGRIPRPHHIHLNINQFFQDNLFPFSGCLVHFQQMLTGFIGEIGNQISIHICISQLHFISTLLFSLIFYTKFTPFAIHLTLFYNTRQRIETLLVDGVKNVDEKKVLEVEN